MKLNPFFALNFFAITAAFTPVPAFSCSPIRVLGVFFEKNSDAVSEEQIKTISNWMIELRDKYPNHESMDVGGAAGRGETAARELGLARARNVAYVLTEVLGFDAKKVFFLYGDNIAEAGMDGPRS